MYLVQSGGVVLVWCGVAMVAGSGCGGAVVLCCIQYYPGPVLPVVAVLSYPLAGGRRTSGELAVAANINSRPSESEQRERLSQL